MKKKTAIVFLTLFIGIAAYLTIPFPALDEEFPPEKPLAFISNELNRGERCQGNTLYVTESSKQYHA